MSIFADDFKIAQSWARELLTQMDVVILDTETTGLDSGAEICQLAVINLSGDVLINTLVKPTRPIPQQASRIHKITDQTVASAPTFADIYDVLRATLTGRRVVIYNVAFDVRMLKQSARPHQLELGHPVLGAAGYSCAMEWYAQWVGDWNDYHGNYRWQRLPGGDHTALGDCQATLAVIKQMAQ